MKGCCRSLVAVHLLLLALILSLGVMGGQARPRGSRYSSSSFSFSMSAMMSSSSSGALRDLQADKKKPIKQVEVNFRKIPPSIPNPTQNRWPRSKPRFG